MPDLFGGKREVSILDGLLEGQPDRAIWHRAAATLQPDEQVAADLDVAASRAARRGSVAEALAAEERAAELSEDQARRDRRLLRAAEVSMELGQTELGRHLLRAAELLDLDGERRACLDWLRELADDATWLSSRRLDSLVEVAERMALGGRPGLARKCLLTAALRCWWESPDPVTRAAVAAAGLSNREIGERLFLSPRTVGSHLYRVFPKLGIITRAELRDALQERVAAAA